MKPFLPMATVVAAVTALAVAPVLSQAQATPGSAVAGKAHKKSHIKARSGQRPPGWRPSSYDQASADSSSSNATMTEASSAAPLQGYPTTNPIPPTMRPADLYGHNASGTGGKTMYPDQKPALTPSTAPLPEQPIADPLCTPRSGSTLTQPNCTPKSQSGTSTSSADSRAPDR